VEGAWLVAVSRTESAAILCLETSRKDFGVNSKSSTGSVMMPGFEEHLTKLESIVEKLEKGDLTLEQSVKLFEEGMRLSDACKAELEQAEGRIQVLVQGKGGKMQPIELETGTEESESGVAGEE
jgi:exodeoxyribonuclease VII small subunit